MRASAKALARFGGIGMLQERCERFVAGIHTEEDLVIIIRSLQSMWSRILEKPVVLRLLDGQIAIETPCKTPSFQSKISMSAALRTKRLIGVQEKEIYYQAIGRLDHMFRKLTPRQMEVLYWRLIDHSRKDGKPVSNRELAAFLGIDESAFRRHLRRIWEKFDGNPVYLSNYVLITLDFAELE